ncbi:MAG: hypothetical protein JAY72_20490 [Candidatus Thiodiazotropha endolucinida]|nr:hypothetical protein [Candidatus Thiodiazotropha taylori]MCW4324061.1 hypothetical protein [Candidatus Thiodiazotropha taylori]
MSFIDMMAMQFAFTPAVMGAMNQMITPVTRLFTEDWSPVSVVAGAFNTALDWIGSLKKKKKEPPVIKVIKRERQRLREANVRLYVKANQWQAHPLSPDELKTIDTYKKQLSSGKLWMDNFLKKHPLKDLKLLMAPGYFSLEQAYVKHFGKVSVDMIRPEGFSPAYGGEARASPEDMFHEVTRGEELKQQDEDRRKRKINNQAQSIADTMPDDLDNLDDLDDLDEADTAAPKQKSKSSAPLRADDDILSFDPDK